MNQNAPTPEELRNLARAPQVDQPLLNEREFDPEEARQPRPLSSHPIVKLSIVGGCLLPIFLFAGIFLGSRQGIHNQNPQPTASTPPSASPLPEAQVNQREKLGQTQAQLALEKQRIELERLRQASSNKPIQKSVARSTTQSQPSANRPVAVAPSSYTPPQPMPRVVIPPERIAAVPPEIVKPVVRNVTRKRVESSEPLPPESSLTQAQKPESRLQSPIDQESSTQSLTDGVVKPRTAIVIAQGEPLQLMTTGTKAEGVLQTPIVVDQPIQQKTLMKPKIATDASQNISDDRFVVVLSEPLQAHDRTIALPAGTEVVAQINSVSNNGLIKLDAISVR
ncbi:hypothetical protein H6F89_29380 [Cyanobacteria bacterium FACHB-63]|nr:hypothetical protein [Cyanobacteria bacterium FACHB-63]